MGSDNRFIYYSTIHLNRREEILVQSIISLYNSKDDYKWAHTDSSDTIVVIVGSDAKALLSAGQDPFSAIKEQHIVCILGDIFYPKNARAVVPIALPIKALHLVDKLSHIEKDILSKPFSVGYIATKQVVDEQESKDTAPPAKGLIDFTPNTDTAEVDVAVTEVTNTAIEPPVTESADTNQATETSTIDALSILNNYNVLKVNITNEAIVESQPTIKETVDYVPPKMVQLNLQTTEDSLDKPISYVKSSLFTAKLETIDNFTHTLTDVVSPELASPTVATPVIPSLQEKNTIPAPTLNEVVSTELETPAVASPVIQTLQEKNTVPAPTLTEVASSALETPAVVAPVIPTLQEKNTVPAPTLTEVASSALETPAVVAPVIPTLQEKNTVPAATLTEVASSALETPVVAPSVIPTLQEKNTVQASTVTEVVPPTVTVAQPVVIEQPAKPVVANVEETNEFSKRIKLIRWPKSEVIQRHPGNAILASMVINVPMSVEDMAKQSDLPLAVCQRFMDAVIESKVAEYVDLVEEKADEIVVKEEPVKEEVKQRKGILYRIRAALGLLRK